MSVTVCSKILSGITTSINWKADLALSSLQQQLPNVQPLQSNDIKPQYYGELFRLQNFFPKEYTQTSIGITSAFLMGFLVLGLLIVVFFSRNKYRKTMVMNQKFILVLVGVLLAVQMFSLISRIIFESISLGIIDDISFYIQKQNGTDAMQHALASMNSTVSATEAGVSDSPILAMVFFGAIYIFTASANLGVITLIVTFVSYVFFKTIKRGGTISKGHYVFLSIFGDALGVFVFVILLLISLTLGIVYLLVSIGHSPDIQTGLYIGVYVPYVVQILLQTFLFNVSSMKEFSIDCNTNKFSAMKVLVIISRNSNPQNKGQYQKPFFKVISIQIILTLCAFIQLIATLIGLIEGWVYSKLLFFIFNNIGILSFTIVAISVYNPLFTINPKMENKSEKTITSPRSNNKINPQTQQQAQHTNV